MRSFQTGGISTGSPLFFGVLSQSHWIRHEYTRSSISARDRDASESSISYWIRRCSLLFWCIAHSQRLPHGFLRAVLVVAGSARGAHGPIIVRLWLGLVRGHIDAWAHRSVGLSVRGHIGPWARRCADTSVRGHIGASAHRCVGILMHTRCSCTKWRQSVGRWSGLTPGCHIMWYRRDLLFDICFKIQLKFIFKNVYPIVMGAAGQGQQG